MFPDRCSTTDWLDSLIIFMHGHSCSTCFLVFSIPQALRNTACLGFHDWDSVFMLVCEVLRALNQIGSLGFSKIIKPNKNFNITVI